MEDKDIKQRDDNRHDGVIATEKVEKKDKKSKKRIVLLLLLLLVTGFLLTTTTYAWFTSNKTVKVSDINVNVASSGGIQISVDGTSWKSIVSTDDITNANRTYAAATNQIPLAMQPVSTAAETILAGGYLPMWYGTVVSNAVGDYIITSTDASTVADNSDTGVAANGSNGYFVSFDLFFKLDAESVDNTSSKVYLTTSSDVIATTDTGIKNASRVGFVIEGETANGSTLDVIQGLAANGTPNNNVFIWEPNYDVHTAAGVSNALDVYGVSTTQTGGSKLPYSGIKAAIAADDNIKLGDATAAKNSAKFADIVPTHETASGWSSGTDYKELFTLNTNKITKVKVYFWVEGQDVDCENNASGGDITLKLQFSLNSSAA